MSAWAYNTYSAKVNDEAVPLVETVPAQRNFRGPNHSPTLHVQQPPGSQVIGDNVIESRCHPSNLITEGTENKRKLMRLLTRNGQVENHRCFYSNGQSTQETIAASVHMKN